MEPTVILGLASATANLLRATGVLKTSADRIAAETSADVKSLLQLHYNAGLAELVLAGSTDSAAERERALGSAAEQLRLAAAQERLHRHLRGFAAGILASLSVRSGDRGGAQHWVRNAAEHYDAAFCGLDRAAGKAIRTLARAPGRGSVLGRVPKSWRGPAVAVGGNAVLGPVLGPVVLPIAARKLAQSASRKLPSDEWLEELAAQAAAVHGLAREVNVPADCLATGLRLDRRQGLIVRSELLREGAEEVSVRGPCGPGVGGRGDQEGGDVR